MPLASGRGPAAQYMENWGGYLRVDGIVGKAIDVDAAQARLGRVLSSTNGGAG
jgi:hypothetical protein